MQTGSTGTPTPASPGIKGRYVRISIKGKGILNLAEVQVFSAGENIAGRGTASQSSTAEGAEAARAIDGRTEGDGLSAAARHEQH